MIAEIILTIIVLFVLMMIIEMNGNAKHAGDD